MNMNRGSFLAASCSLMRDLSGVVEDERRARQLHPRVESNKHDQLFQHFVVVGIAPSDGENQPTTKILYQYPSSPGVNFASFLSFCMPQSFKVKSFGLSDSHSELLELMCGSNSQIHDPEKSHVFELHPDNEKLFGFCISVESPVVDAFGKSIENTTQFATRCYCILSYYPFYDLHFEVLRDILVMQRMTHLDGLHNYLSNEEAVNTPKSPKESRAAIDDFLRRYYKTKVPNPGETIFMNGCTGAAIQFMRPFGDAEVTSVTRFGLPVLLHCLSTELVLVVLSAVLLERRVLLISPHLRRVAAAVQMLGMLVRPFLYQGVILPVCPPDLSSILAAPVPFLIGQAASLKDFPKLYDSFANKASKTKPPTRLSRFSNLLPGDRPRSSSPAGKLSSLATASSSISPRTGMRSTNLLQGNHHKEASLIVEKHVEDTSHNERAMRPIEDTEVGEDVIVVVLEENRIITLDDIPLLPNFEVLKATIDNYYMMFCAAAQDDVVTPGPKYSISGKQEELLVAITVSIEAHVSGLFANFRKHCIKDVSTPEDPVTVFLRESFAKLYINSNGSEFMNKFMETQMFSHWCDIKLRSLDEQK